MNVRLPTPFLKLFTEARICPNTAFRLEPAATLRLFHLYLGLLAIWYQSNITLSDLVVNPIWMTNPRWDSEKRRENLLRASPVYTFCNSWWTKIGRKTVECTLWVHFPALGTCFLSFIQHTYEAPTKCQAPGNYEQKQTQSPYIASREHGSQLSIK